MKIALAQFNPTVGDFEGNRARILKMAAEAASRGGDLAVFSELCLCGYPPQDLIERVIALDEAATLLPTFDTASPAGITIIDPRRA